MPCCLAYADTADTSSLNLQVVMTCAGILLAAAAVAFVPVAIRWSRRRGADGLALAALLWGALAAASVARATLARVDYAREWERRVRTGYYDPADRSDAPALPWMTWAALGAAYAGLVAWSLAPSGSAPPPPQAPIHPGG